MLKNLTLNHFTSHASFSWKKAAKPIRRALACVSIKKPNKQTKKKVKNKYFDLLREKIKFEIHALQ